MTIPAAFAPSGLLIAICAALAIAMFAIGLLGYLRLREFDDEAESLRQARIARFVGSKTPASGRCAANDV